MIPSPLSPPHMYVGSAGLTGQKGERGNDGTPGTPGPRGLTGPQGPPGMYFENIVNGKVKYNEPW